MTTYRSTNEEKQQRINFAADELAKGKRAMDISKKLAKKYNVSIQQARDYVRQAKPVLTESISPNDRAFIFSKVMNCLEQDRLDASFLLMSIALLPLASSSAAKFTRSWICSLVDLLFVMIPLVFVVWALGRIHLRIFQRCLLVLSFRIRF